jgi:hypothetical protein
MYACMHVCMIVYVYIYLCMYVCKYVCIYACMYVCIYACMYEFNKNSNNSTKYVKFANTKFREDPFIGSWFVMLLRMNGLTGG